MGRDRPQHGARKSEPAGKAALAEYWAEVRSTTGGETTDLDPRGAQQREEVGSRLHFLGKKIMA